MGHNQNIIPFFVIHFVTHNHMTRIAIFASGSGSNAQNIIEFFNDDEGADVVLVLTNNPNAFVLTRAKSLGVESHVFTRKSLVDKDGVLKTLKNFSVDCIVLAGFLWKFPKHILEAFGGPVVNIHPALLPKYGGKGMYGMHVHRSVVENKESETGITIHHVNEFYDEGAIIFQAKCPVYDQDTPEDVAQKIHNLEMQYVPKVIKQLLVDNV